MSPDGDSTTAPPSQSSETSDQHRRRKQGPNGPQVGPNVPHGGPVGHGGPGGRHISLDKSDAAAAADEIAAIGRHMSLDDTGNR